MRHAAQTSLTINREAGVVASRTLEIQLPFQYAGSFVLLSCTVELGGNDTSHYKVTFDDPKDDRPMTVNPADVGGFINELHGALDAMLEHKIADAFQV